MPLQLLQDALECAQEGAMATCPTCAMRGSSPGSTGDPGCRSGSDQTLLLKLDVAGWRGQQQDLQKFHMGLRSRVEGAKNEGGRFELANAVNSRKLQFCINPFSGFLCSARTDATGTDGTEVDAMCEAHSE